MTRSNNNNNSNNDDNKNRRRASAKRRKIEPPRKPPDSERGLTHSPYFNGTLYERMSQDLHLGGMAKRTHEGYLRAVRQLADFCKCSPDKVTEDQLRNFFLHQKNDQNFASGSLRVSFSGVSFSTPARANVTGKRWLRCESLLLVSPTRVNPASERRATLCIFRAPARRFFSSTLTRSLCNSARC